MHPIDDWQGLHVGTAAPYPPIDDLPYVVLGEPPYSVYTAGHATRLGEVATAEDAISLVVAHLPADLGADAVGQQS
ncbi:DUF6193 family natural product biosynthesis protein [Streptomyces sp. NPDC054841]